MSGTRVSRRAMLGSVGAASLSPVLQASVPDISGLRASPDPPLARLAFTATLQTDEIHESPCGARDAAIIGGSLQGHRLSGTVQAGRIQWSAPSAEAMVEVRTHVLVMRQDGTLVEVHDRGLMPAGADPGQASISTRPELTGEREEQDVPVLLVGRLDASEVLRGVLRLQAFEVS